MMIGLNGNHLKVSRVNLDLAFKNFNSAFNTIFNQNHLDGIVLVQNITKILKLFYETDIWYIFEKRSKLSLKSN